MNGQKVPWDHQEKDQTGHQEKVDQEKVERITLTAEADGAEAWGTEGKVVMREGEEEEDLVMKDQKEISVKIIMCLVEEK